LTQTFTHSLHFSSIRLEPPSLNHAWFIDSCSFLFASGGWGDKMLHYDELWWFAVLAHWDTQNWIFCSDLKLWWSFVSKRGESSSRDFRSKVQQILQNRKAIGYTSILWQKKHDTHDSYSVKWHMELHDLLTQLLILKCWNIEEQWNPQV